MRPQRRSALYTPADDQEMMRKTFNSVADGVVFDLEDAVPDDAKADARMNLQTIVQSADVNSDSDDDTMEVATRINGLETDHWETDLSAAVEAGVDAVCIPMVEHPDEVQRVHTTLTELSDDPPGIRIGIESPAGLFGGTEIARTGQTTGAVSLSFGVADYCRELGTPGISDRIRASLEFLTSSYAALGDLEAFASVYLDLDDETGLRHAAERAREVGFVGMMAIHPKQLPVINEVFTPSEEEVEQARQLVIAFDESDRDSLVVDGVFLDTATADRYRDIVERYERATGSSPP